MWDMAGKPPVAESTVGDESPKVWAKPARVQCTQCCAAFYLDFFGKKPARAAALAMLVPIITVTIVSGDRGSR